ncbi:preprotein translocase subunit SecG [Lampropedia aestuarii]|uniref:Protein-export membrane protein SecG n=1 Tax=Lampropedia aestuarii TaxID=2562762 RepID=A0A4S5BYN5_9BURK|nr:preprotein translocase subunit SecG [Lampropedia aestuarii]THJ36431.1 preprotein translocase subunit SecG [Lampropedia aestuarii]
MSMWMTVVLAFQILAALTMAGLILVQHGKGADMGASLGAGSAGSLFGASGSANFLSRMTALSATVFFAATLVLAFMAGSGMQRPNTSTGSSVLENATFPVPGETGPVSEIPGAGATAAPAVNVPPATGSATVDSIPDAAPAANNEVAPETAPAADVPAAASGEIAPAAGDAPAAASAN